MHDPNDILVAVSVYDPAIDWAKTDLGRYQETRDLRLVHAIPGMTLREVSIRPLRFHEMAAIASSPGEAGVVMAFRQAVTQIRNAQGADRHLAPSVLRRQANGTDARTWEDDDLQLVMELFGWKFLLEMADIAITRAREGKAWSGTVTYTLPPLCKHALTMHAARLAELGRRTATPAPTGASASSKTPSAPGSATSSAEATDAPALAGTANEAGSPPPQPNNS